MPNQSLNIDQFSKGWIPSDDPLSGRKNGLLQMDNVELDKNGALTMAGGTSVVQTYPTAPHTLYSCFMNGSRIDYAALASGAIYRNNTSIATGGDTKNAAFATAFDYTLAASGNVRKKDNGTTVSNLGILPPTIAPVVAPATDLNAPYTNFGAVITNLVAPTGLGTVTVISSQYMQGTTNSDGLLVIQTYPGAKVDCSSLEGVSGEYGYQLETDFITLNGYVLGPAGCSLQFDVLLEDPNSSGDQVLNYYTYLVSDLGNLTFNPVNGSFTIMMQRNQFQRIGSGIQGWESVYGFRITFNNTNATVSIVNIWANALGNAFRMQGGSNSCTGTYQYTQMNVNNTGSYIAKSVLSPVSLPVYLNGSQATITPQDPTSIDAQCNEAWIFRRSISGGFLDQWYRVKVFKLASAWAQAYDNVGDQEALATDVTVNPYLISINSTSITDKIFDIIGPIEGRWFYFTTNMMYPSDINDPDLVDVARSVRICGSNNEVFLWARKVTDSIVLVGTSHDIYVLSGTFITQPDFSIDIYYKPLGCKFPPISYDADVYSGNVYYLSSDGWRSFNYLGNNPYNQFGSESNSYGTNPLLVSPDLDVLYRGDTINTPFKTPSYTAPTLNVAPGSVRFPIAIVKNKLWCFITGTGRCEVYDFIRQYWRVINYSLGDVSAAITGPDGSVLVSYVTDKKLRSIGISSSKLIDGVTLQTVGVTFPIADNGTPKQRKDPYTFKLMSFTGTYGNLTIKIADENQNVYSVSTSFQSITKVVEKDIDISSLITAPIKTFWVYLTGQLSDFILTGITIEHDLRPVQLTFLRLTANNYNAVARKRIYNVPFQIDTLGNPVIISDIADDIVQPSLTVKSTRKQSFSYDYTLINNDVTRAVDHEFTIDGQGKLFEWYGFQDILPQDIEVFPTPNRAYVIPVTNFGNPLKKRLRVWPFILDTRGYDVTFTPISDGAIVDKTTVFNNKDKLTVYHKFTTDVFGVDYSGTFSSNYPFELWGILPPDIVQVLPIARHFDQVGPEELFRYGRIKKLEIRVFSFGTTIPLKIYFNDNTSVDENIDVTPGIEASYFYGMPKGTGGEIVRIVLGPTDFDFHRYYIRLLVMKSGADSELEWMTLPAPQETPNA